MTGWLATLIRYFQLVRLAGLAMRSVRRLRERVYTHVLRLPMAYFDRAITGQLVSRITNDTEAVKQLYTQVLFELLLGLTVLFGVVVAMLWLDWRLMLIVLLLVPATVGIVLGYQRLSAAAVARSRALRSDINAQMAEGIAGMSVLQAMGAAARFAGRFARTNDAHYAARMGEVRANAWLLRPALDFVNILLIVAIIAAVGTQRLEGVEVGLLYAFIAYVARVVEPLIQITMQFSLLQQSVIAAARVNTLLEETAPPPTVHARRIESGSVELAHVSFGYDAAAPVLHDVSLSVPAGAFVGIVGHTGSGKSHAAVAAAALLPRRRPAASRSAASPSSRSATRSSAPTSGWCRRSRSCSPPTRTRTSTWAAGCPRRTSSRPRRPRARTRSSSGWSAGYRTPLGEGGARLSSGEKQLIAVARALAGQPRILFLDEATSRIDSETEQHVQAALAELRGRTTVVAIAHRLSTIRAADAIVVLNHGRIAETGHARRS